MADLQVKCVNKQPRNDPHEGITYLGGDGWKYSRAQVVTMIETGVHKFHTLVNGNRASVGVISGPNGKYVRTHADGKWNDNLLALYECV